MTKPPGKLFTLWPCHNWEDFPVQMPLRQASSFLACATSMWHPRLVLAANCLPQMWKIDRLSELPGNSFVSIPDICNDNLNDSQIKSLRQAGTTLAIGKNRREVLDCFQANENIGLLEVGDTVADFFALGYCWFQIHLMTRQIRYAGGLDEESLERSLLAAALAWQQSSARSEIDRHLQSCFDLLFQERIRFYPADASLYRVILASPVTSFTGLKTEIVKSGPASILTTAEDVETIRETDFGLFQSIKERSNEKQLDIVAPLDFECSGLLSHCSSSIQAFVAGRSHFAELQLEQSPVFGRRRSGISFDDPVLAHQFGFSLALHASFDSRSAPRLSAPQVLWQSPSGESIPAFAEAPLDINRDDCLLRLGAAIGEMVDSWHYADVILAGWPGQHSAFYDDLVKTTRFGNLLGKFRTLSSGAGNSEAQSYGEQLLGDDYDRPISFPDRATAWKFHASLHFYWTRMAEILLLRRVAIMLAIYRLTFPSKSDSQLPTGTSNIALERLGKLEREIRKVLAQNPGKNESDSIDSGIETVRQLLAGAFTGSGDNPENGQAGRIRSETRPLSLHALIHASNHASSLSCSLSIKTRTEESSNNAETAHSGFVAGDGQYGVRLADQTESTGRYVVKAPATGVIILDPAVISSGRQWQKEPAMLDGETLRNEFVSVEMNRATGGIAAFRRAGQRKSIASQRLAVRLVNPSGNEPSRYGELRLREFRFIEQGRFRASCIASGEILNCGEILARFKQETTLTRGSHLVELNLLIQPLVELDGEIGQSCFCSRLAWSDTMAKRWRYLCETKQRCCREQFTAPTSMEIETDSERLTLLTGGYGWHRQSALNILDTLVPDVPGMENSFRMGIGLGIDRPLEQGMQLMAGPFLAEWPETGPAADFRLAGWEPSTLHWFGGELARDPEGNTIGIVFGFRETEGEKGSTSIQFPGTIFRAEVRNAAGKKISDIEVVGGRVHFSWRAFQIFSVAIYYKP